MTGAANWFISTGTAARWLPQVFCFPHAGGSPRAFLDWQDALHDEAEIVAVCRPGREHRSAEPPPTIEEFIDGAATAIAAVTETDGRPCYLFGHSLGALIGFEVCRRLPGQATPRHFIASGCSAPALLPSQRVKDIAALSGRDFAEAVGFFGGLPADVIADQDMCDLLLPPLIADFYLAARYRYQPGPRVTVPATVVVGRDDPHVKAAQIEPWSEEFSWPPDHLVIPGGHFYFDGNPAAAVEVVRAVIRADQHTELI